MHLKRKENKFYVQFYCNILGVEMEEKGLINYASQEVITTLKQTVAQHATEAEFNMFVSFAKATGLNPFKKELWFIKSGDKVQMMTGINGFLAIANSHPMFDGMEVSVEENAQGIPLKAIAKVYRKDRKFPSVGIAKLSEFAKGTPIWKQMPTVMLTKVAKSIAIREAFPQELNGLYTEEEMPKEFSFAACQNQPPTVEVVEDNSLERAKEIAQNIQAQMPNAEIKVEAKPQPSLVGDYAYGIPYNDVGGRNLAKQLNCKFHSAKAGGDNLWHSATRLEALKDYLASEPAPAKDIQLQTFDDDDIPF